MIDFMVNTAVQVAIEIVNTEFQDPFDLKTLNPEYMVFIAQVFTNPRVTPFYQDEYIYAGITYFFDPFSFSKLEKLNFESQIIGQHSPALSKFVGDLLF